MRLLGGNDLKELQKILLGAFMIKLLEKNRVAGLFKD